MVLNNSFLQEDFLLQSTTAKKLYHDYAEKMPIYDYHCHVSPKEIWEDRKYENLTQAWLYGDHYKWRLMRAMGMDESLITGGAGDYRAVLCICRDCPLLHRQSNVPLGSFGAEAFFRDRRGTDPGNGAANLGKNKAGIE